MNKEIETLIKKITIRDVQIALLNAQEGRMIIPDEVFRIIEQVEKNYENTK